MVTEQTADSPAAPLGEIVALYQAGRYGDMETAVRRLLERSSNDATLWQLLGVALLMSQRPDQAIEPLRRAIALAPGLLAAHSNLGQALHQLGRYEDAVLCYRHALTLNANVAEIHGNLAAVLHDLRCYDEALDCHRRALQLKPASAKSYFNQGNTLAALGKLDAAVASFQEAIRLGVTVAEVHDNLGAVLADLGRFEDALAVLRHAVAMRPDHAPSHARLGAVYEDMGRYEDAIFHCQRALALDATMVSAYLGLARLWVVMGYPAKSIACYRRVVDIDAKQVEGRDLILGMANAYEVAGRHDDALGYFEKFLDRWPEFPAAYDNLLFTLNYHPRKTPQEIYAVYEGFDARFGAPLRGAWQAHGNDRALPRRLKVGYVSPDFNNHPVRRFLEPLLAQHDRTVVELYAYAELMREDEVTAHYKGFFDHWVATRGLTDDGVAERIRADGIDILVDVAGHTAGNRLGVFARKPAPVSVSCLGFAYTTGLKSIDYFLTDEVSAPEGTEAFYSEALWWLPGTGYVYRPADGMGDVSVLPAQGRGYVTFGTLTRAIRINDRLIGVWAEILRRVPGSRLVVDSANFRDADLCADLVRRFADQGVAGDRLMVGCHSPPWDVLRGMDIGLDCFPHNSGTTLFESLYMGVPYVTLAGETSPRRLGGSILTGVGHGEWIAATEAEYIEKAVALAADLPKLAAIRAKLRGEMTASPLMDEAGFARKVEAAYREMFKRWVEREGELER